MRKYNRRGALSQDNMWGQLCRSDLRVNHKLGFRRLLLCLLLFASMMRANTQTYGAPLK